MRHAGIVVRREVVSDNQADNPKENRQKPK
jgi:hypothetical protein